MGRHQRPRRRRTLAHLLRHDSVYGPFPGTVEVDGPASSSTASRSPSSEGDPSDCPGRRAASMSSSSAPGGSNRVPTRRCISRPGARKVIVSAPGKDVDVTIVRGVNEDAYDPAVARRDLECVLHDELPGARGDGAERRVRHPARHDDDDSRVHGRPAPRRPAAQGSSPRACGGDQHRADVDRSREGAAPRHPRARGKLHGVAARVPVPTGSLIDLTVELETVDDCRGDHRGVRRARRLGCARGHLSSASRPLVSSE